MTADISPNETSQSEDVESGSSMAGTYVLVAAVLFVAGLAILAIASFQLVIPDVLGGIAVASYGRLVQAARTLVFDGWLPLAALGLSVWAIGEITGDGIQRKVLGTVSLVLIALGAAVGAGSILAGMSTGVSGLESPVWARAISTVGFVLAALMATATARQKRDNLGPAGGISPLAPGGCLPRLSWDCYRYGPAPQERFMRHSLTRDSIDCSLSPQRSASCTSLSRGSAELTCPSRDLLRPLGSGRSRSPGRSWAVSPSSIQQHQTGTKH